MNSDDGVRQKTGSTHGMSEKHICDSCGKEYTTGEGLRYHYNNTKCEVDGIDCPSCDNTFKNEHAVRSHHSQVHGGPGIHGTVKVNCEWCGEEIRRKRYYVEKRNRFYCDSECQRNWKSEHQGSYRWDESKTNYSASYYGSNWPKQRQKRLEIDGFECVVCGMSDEEHQERQGRSLSVHHIKEIDNFRDGETNQIDEEKANALTNLITMCRPCHRKWESIPLTPENRAISDLTSAGALAVSELQE